MGCGHTNEQPIKDEPKVLHHSIGNDRVLNATNLTTYRDYDFKGQYNRQIYNPRSKDYLHRPDGRNIIQTITAWPVGATTWTFKFVKKENSTNYYHIKSWRGDYLSNWNGKPKIWYSSLENDNTLWQVITDGSQAVIISNKVDHYDLVRTLSNDDNDGKDPKIALANFNRSDLSNIWVLQPPQDGYSEYQDDEGELVTSMQSQKIRIKSHLGDYLHQPAPDNDDPPVTAWPGETDSNEWSAFSFGNEWAFMSSRNLYLSRQDQASNLLTVINEPRTWTVRRLKNGKYVFRTKDHLGPNSSGDQTDWLQRTDAPEDDWHGKLFLGMGYHDPWNQWDIVFL